MNEGDRGNEYDDDNNKRYHCHRGVCFVYVVYGCIFILSAVMQFIVSVVKYQGVGFVTLGTAISYGVALGVAVFILGAVLFWAQTLHARQDKSDEIIGNHSSRLSSLERNVAKLENPDT